jgi:hypothetical protein
MEENEKIEMIRERIGIKTLSMNSVPDSTYKRFIDMANNEFCGHYGLALKHLQDFYDGLIPTGYEHLEIEISRIIEEVEKIKEEMSRQNKEDDKNIKKMLDGGIRNVTTN